MQPVSPRGGCTYNVPPHHPQSLQQSESPSRKLPLTHPIFLHHSEIQTLNFHAGNSPSLLHNVNFIRLNSLDDMVNEFNGWMAILSSGRYI